MTLLMYWRNRLLGGKSFPSKPFSMWHYATAGCIATAGESGSGKTTLARLLLRLLADVPRLHGWGALLAQLAMS